MTTSFNLAEVTPWSASRSNVTRDAVVACWDSASAGDRNAFKIAEFMGVNVTFFRLCDLQWGGDKPLSSLGPKCVCLIVSMETLVQLAAATAMGMDGVRALLRLAEHVFVYGVQSNEHHSKILALCSANQLRDVHPLDGNNHSFDVLDQREHAGAFSGLTFRAAETETMSCFDGAGAHGQGKTIIRADGKPFFVQVVTDHPSMYLVACDRVADLDEAVPRGTSVVKWFSSLVPLMMFLRATLGNKVWRNDEPRACLIIDDPLLRTRYGFLRYQQLIKRMGEQAFSTCIAFIPWNYRRSSAKVAALISKNRVGPNLCVHGCDHTRGEFAPADFELLRGKAALALERMREHRQLTGISFDDVMVFPQGLFSREAMAALKANHYLAAINSDVYPSGAQETLPLRDLIDVAITRFAGIPLFGRRYPKAIEEFAFDLFVGKPAFVVEHHGYFRDGLRSWKTFVSQLAGLDQRLQWSSPAAICSGAAMTKTSDEGEIHLRFFTSLFRLENTTTAAQRYVLLPAQSSFESLPTVTVNGQDCRTEWDRGQLQIRLVLAPGQKAELRILPRNSTAAHAPHQETWSDNLRVLVRRGLSELRDNYVHTNRFLSAIVSSLVSLRRNAKLPTTE